MYGVRSVALSGAIEIENGHVGQYCALTQGSGHRNAVVPVAHIVGIAHLHEPYWRQAVLKKPRRRDAKPSVGVLATERMELRVELVRSSCAAPDVLDRDSQVARIAPSDHPISGQRIA